MRKYYYILKLSLQHQFSDAAKPFIWIFGEGVQAFVFAFIWLAVSGGQDTVGNTPTSNLITYYFFIFINWFIIGGFSHLIMVQSIREGTLTNQLARPIIPFAMDVIKEQGWKLFGLITGIPILFLLILIFQEYIKFNFNLETILYTLPAIIMGAIVFALIDFMIAFSAFWLHKIDGFRYLTTAVNSVLGGYIIPFELLPRYLSDTAVWLPFRYTFAFAAQIFQENLSLGEMYFGFILQATWIVLLGIIVYITYKISLRQYETYGG